MASVKNKHKVIFIIDDERSIDFCCQLNNHVKDKNDVFYLVKNCDSAIKQILFLAEQQIKIDKIMLDHDLADGKDVSTFLNWILRSSYDENLYLSDDDFSKIAYVISESVWFIHTANPSVVQSMKDKIAQLNKYIKFL